MDIDYRKLFIELAESVLFKTGADSLKIIKEFDARQEPENSILKKKRMRKKKDDTL